MTDESTAAIHLVATDLDGTIIRHDGTVSPRVVAAIAAVEALGVPVVFVTGRPPRWMAQVVGLTALHGVAVCANGAVVYDLHRDVVLERYELEPDLALETVRRLRAVMPAVTFAIETADGFFHEAAYVPRWAVPETIEYPDAEAMLAGPVAKLLVRDETSSGDAMLALAQPAIGDLVTVTHSNVKDCLLEVSAPGVTKATTLARVAAGHGVDASAVLAFGDQPNDIDMLAWAGTGYAMGGGHPDVLAVVTTHAASVEDDGVARVIERFLAAGAIRSPDASDRSTRSG